jgi:hypothetical protein
MKEVEKLLDEIENQAIQEGFKKFDTDVYKKMSNKYKQLIMDIIKTIDDEYLSIWKTLKVSRKHLKIERHYISDLLISKLRYNRKLKTRLIEQIKRKV